MENVDVSNKKARKNPENAKSPFQFMDILRAAPLFKQANNPEEFFGDSSYKKEELTLFLFVLTIIKFCGMNH
jgi:hypothetical protein